MGIWLLMHHEHSLGFGTNDLHFEQAIGAEESKKLPVVLLLATANRNSMHARLHLPSDHGMLACQRCARSSEIFERPALQQCQHSSVAHMSHTEIDTSFKTDPAQLCCLA